MIQIKPGNEGKFGAFARSVGMSVQEAARHVLANRERYSASRVKQANFARNAAGWKHQEGGVVNGEWRMENGGLGGNSQFSRDGYKMDSPDRFNAFNIIPSNQITMKGVPHPVMGVDNLGNRQLMMPGAEYRFPGQAVLETPLAPLKGGGRERMQVGGPTSAKATVGEAVVDETQAQKDWLLSLAKSKKYTDHLNLEYEGVAGADVNKILDQRLNSFGKAIWKYHKDLPSWIQGAYVPEESKGLVYQDGWKPAGPVSDPIYGVDQPNTVYLSTKFQPGNVPDAKDATTPSHEGNHALLGGDKLLSDRAIKTIYDVTSQGDEPDRVQLNGMTFGYSNEPSEMISRMQAIRYLLNKNNLYDARTQNFTDDVYDKMINDPMIKNNSDFQDFYNALRGNEAEKKQHFMRLMNEIASRSNGNGSTMAREGGEMPAMSYEPRAARRDPLARSSPLKARRFQDGGGTSYTAPEGYAPSTPEQRANWNQFLNYMESQGMAGSPDLDIRDKHLGLQYLNTYNKAYPKAQVSESFIPTAQYENYLIRRENRFPTMSKEQSEVAFSNLSPAYKQYPLSGVDNWFGRQTSKQFYPTFRSGKALHKADGTEQVDSYDFGVNFEDYVQSKADSNVAQKYLVRQATPPAIRQMGGTSPYGIYNPFSAGVDPSIMMAAQYPGFQNFMQNRDVLSKGNGVSTDPNAGNLDTDIYGVGRMKGFQDFMKKKTILSKDNQNPFGQNDPFAEPKPAPSKTYWSPNVGAAAGVVAGMSFLNNALESGDRNRYNNWMRMRTLGDNIGPVVPGNAEDRRGDYAANDGSFRNHRLTTTQFGVAQMGGSVFSEPTTNVPVMEAPEMPVMPEMAAGNGELRMENPTSAEATAGKGESGARVNPNEAAQSAFEYYVDNRGLAPHVAAGIVGNLYQESGLQTDVEEKGNTGNGRGIAQWDVRDRWKGLHKWAEKNQRDPYDLYTQLDYILDEPGEGAKVLKALEKAQTPEEAAKIFGKVYERPSEKHANWKVRTGVARSLYAGAAEPEYREGGEYEVSEAEVRRILREGGEVEFL